jgi:hypothetical protein
VVWMMRKVVQFSSDFCIILSNATFCSPFFSHRISHHAFNKRFCGPWSMMVFTFSPSIRSFFFLFHLSLLLTRDDDSQRSVSEFNLCNVCAINWVYHALCFDMQLVCFFQLYKIVINDWRYNALLNYNLLQVFCKLKWRLFWWEKEIMS